MVARQNEFLHKYFGENSSPAPLSQSSRPKSKQWVVPEPAEPVRGRDFEIMKVSYEKISKKNIIRN